jgi:two-component system, LuxR family, sensor kinase FixL
MSTKPPNIIDTPADYQHALEALRASEERNRAILKALPDMMFLMSADDVFLDYHAKDAGQLIVPPELFLGRNITDIMPPPLAEQLRDAFKRARLSGGPEILEYSLGVDDQARFYEARVVGCDGEKVLSIVRDITDRKRAELDADIHRRELAHLSRVWLLGELSSALAHELNQPLTAILSNAQAARAFLNHDPVDLAEVRAGLDDIIMNDKRASAVIDRVRDLLKKGSNEWQPTNVNEVVAEVLELTHSDMLARRVAVTTQLATAAPIVHADRVQLMQVLLNLVLNACDAMADIASIDRRLTITTALDDGFARIAVIDRGVGLPPTQLAAVFEPFVTSKKHGLGLGLAISRSIVIAHRGSLSAENNADGGASFTCVLPATAPASPSPSP